jgi:hypothetical protein
MPSLRPTKSACPSFRPTFERLEDREVPATLYGLTPANQLIRFDSATPNSIQATVTVLGLNATEQVVGIDFRPRTGQLYAVAVNGNGGGTAARLLTVNPFTGATTAVGTGFTLPTNTAGAGFGVDFNPTVDLLRVVSTADVNLRVNPNTGALAGTDTPILPAGQRIGGVAYDRNFDGRLGAAGTTLYAINPTTGQLVTQGGVNQTPSPNTGTLLPVGSLNTPIDRTTSVGFDAAGRGAAGGTGFATFDGDAAAGVTTNLYTVNLGTGAATPVGAVGIGTPLLGIAVVPESWFAAGGTTGVVELRDAPTGNLLRTLTPFPGFRGEIRVAVGDVNRDSVPDVIAAAGVGGGSHVKAFDGGTGAELYSFFAYQPAFTGGVFVAAGDVDGDGFADILTGAGATGGPHVKAFSGATGAEIRSFFAYQPGYTGGVRVGAVDVNADGLDEVMTAAGAGGAPHVKLFNGQTAAEQLSFFAYGTQFTGGVFIAGGDVNGDGVGDILTGAGPGGGPHVKAFDGKTGAEVASFFAFNSGFDGGVRVGVADRTRDGRFEVLVAPGPGRGVAVRAFDAPTGNLFDELSTVLSGADGAFVAGMRV